MADQQASLFGDEDPEARQKRLQELADRNAETARTRKSEGAAQAARTGTESPEEYAAKPAMIIGPQEEGQVVHKPDGSVATRGEFPKGFSPDGRAMRDDGKHVTLEEWYRTPIVERYGPWDGFYLTQMRDRAPEIFESLEEPDPDDDPEPDPVP